MAWASLGDTAIIEARVELPRVGAWTADLALDTAEPPTGQVVLDLNGFQLTGTVRWGGMVADTSIVRVVGGAGGLGQELDPLSYQGVPLQVPLQDVLAAAGEALDAQSDPSLLQLLLPFWMRRRGPAGACLGQLVRQVPGAAWRMQPNGEVWAGVESWPDASLSDSDYLVLREDPSNRREQLFADTPSLLPGTTFRGRHVSVVEHSISADQLRMVAWYE
jgi:hypothetical protein